MSANEPVLALCRELMRRRSVSPDDAGCQDVLRARLEAAGFACRDMPFGPVRNLWATHGDAGPTVVLAGHTDVVPSGPETAWNSPPFEPTERDGLLYGRGAADMKGSLAAMIVAVERYLETNPRHPGRIAFLITSDEESAAVDGTRAVVAALVDEGVQLDYCLVGEPSSDAALGDTVRVGRRGSLNGELRVRGIQGHVAYPERVRNPLHDLAPALAELARTRWDEGNEYFPPTSFQASNLTAGTGANNVVPGTAELVFNFRFCTEQTEATLKTRVEAMLDAHGLDYELHWALSGQPFLTAGGALVDAVIDAIRGVTGRSPALSTSGGTSDGRFIAPTGCEVVELGPRNHSIHQVDEHVAPDELVELARIYQRVLERLLEPAASA